MATLEETAGKIVTVLYPAYGTPPSFVEVDAPAGCTWSQVSQAVRARRASSQVWVELKGFAPDGGVRFVVSRRD